MHFFCDFFIFLPVFLFSQAFNCRILYRVEGCHGRRPRVVLHNLLQYALRFLSILRLDGGESMLRASRAISRKRASTYVY